MSHGGKKKERGEKRVRRPVRKRYMALAVLFILCAAYILIHKFTQLPVYLYGSALVGHRFRTVGTAIQYKSGKEWEDFQVRGINFEIPSALEADYDFYREWLARAGEMNANTIRADRLMDPEFYRAFADYNQGRRRPLFLLQGIYVDPSLSAKYMDAGEADLEGRLISAAKDAVDAVHGNLPRRGYGASVSKYVLGFMVGRTWDPDFVIYTNRTGKDAGFYRGKYIETAQTATAFENILARTVDKIFAYDTGKYKTQHLVAFGNEHNTDNLVREAVEVNSLDENRARLDENILHARGGVKTGVFAAYEVNMGVSEEFNYEPRYRDYITEEGESSPFQRYLLDLKEVHETMPVVITGFGLSTSRGASGTDEINGYDRGGLTEEKQAQGLVRLYRDILAVGLSGGCVTELFDNPDKTAWNTEKYVDGDGVGRWLNVQDSEQGLGLVRLSASREEEMAVDGDLSDWEGIKPYLTDRGNEYFLVYDEKYVYLAGRIRGYNDKRDKVYLAFDINPKTGGKRDGERGLSFDRNMDFLLTISGGQGARLSVQEYYNAPAATEPELAGEGSGIWAAPARDSGVFREISQFVQRKTFLQNDPDMSVEELAQRLQETGSLYEDTGDIVEESGFLSARAGDYASSRQGFEVRVPWMLLNFSDPSRMKILGDVYDYGADGVTVEEMYVQTFYGKGSAGVTAPAGRRIGLEGWEDGPEFGFVKKEAYNAMKELWGGD